MCRQGCLVAEKMLCDWTYCYVERIVLSLHIYMRDHNEYLDVCQNSWVLCNKAMYQYRVDLNCMLKTYLAKVIKNQVYSTTRKQYLEKERFYDGAIALDEISLYGYSNEAIVEDQKQTYQPSVQLIVKEETTYYNQQILEQCSPLEQQVIAWKLEGYMQWEIARYLDVDVKVVYNAMYRLQKKLGYCKSN